MGEVYLVEHQALGRREALKVLRKSFAQSPRFLSRFRREARALNRLKHANIVCVYDFGTLADGGFYLSAEYADGESLRTLLERDQRMPVARSIRILCQLASAVSHAHTRGIIHRDLKPENLILEQDHRGRDVLKVLDFGVAKIVAPDYEDQSEVTRQGSVYGTPHYMSPEQVHGEGKEPRIDIYAVGCIAFELVTGKPPFTGHSPMAVMRSQVYDPVPRLAEQDLPEPVPAEFESVVRKCLAKEPDKRFQDGRELLEALRAIPQPEPKREESNRALLNRHGNKTAVLRKPRPAEDLDHAFEEAATLVDPPIAQILAQAEPTGARHEVASAEYITLDRLLMDLGEQMQALGCDAPMLAVQLNLVQGLQSELEQWSDELEALEQRRDQIEERARHREATLRFSLGELRFEYDRAKKQALEQAHKRPARRDARSDDRRDARSDARSDDKNDPLVARLRPLLELLEQRLAHSNRVKARDLMALDNQNSLVEQTGANRTRQFEAALTRLQALLRDLAAPYAHDRAVAEMLEQLREFENAT